MSILDDTAYDHELVAVTAAGRFCRCGAERTLEHLADVWGEVLGVLPPTNTELRRRSNAMYARERHRRIAAETMAANLDRTRALLRKLNEEQEALGREADAIGFRTFADRADYLISRDPWWHYRHGWQIFGHPFINEQRSMTA